MPIIAVMALFHAVSLWNQYFTAMIYLNERSLYPLQLILREILVINQMGLEEDSAGSMESLVEQVRVAGLVKYYAIIFSSLTFIILFSFFLRVFLIGVFIGFVKELFILICIMQGWMLFGMYFGIGFM